MSDWCWYFGDPEDARGYCEKAIRIGKEYGIPEFEAFCSQILGFTTKIADLEAAMNHFRNTSEELSLSQSLVGLKFKIEAPLYLRYRSGWAYSIAKADSTKALPFFLKAISMAKKVGNANWLFFSQLADLYCYLPSGELSNVRAETLSSIDSPFFAFRITRILAYSILGNLCLIEGDMGQAEDWLLKALSNTTNFHFKKVRGVHFSLTFLIALLVDCSCVMETLTEPRNTSPMVTL